MSTHYAISHDRGALVVTACPIHKGRKTARGHVPVAYEWTRKVERATCRACLRWLSRHTIVGATARERLATLTRKDD